LENMQYVSYIIYGAIFIAVVYLITAFIFDILLRGFLPLIASRPWVVEELMGQIVIPQANPRLLAFSTGRSGVFHALEQKYPDATLTGVESSLFPYLVSKMQTLIRHTRIKIVHLPVHHVSIKNADFIYCHLHPDELRFLSAKFKFDCRPGTQIVSTGFNIPYLEPKKIIDLPDRKGRLDWFSKNQKLFQSKQKKFQKENKAYLYEI
jgi:hypothetical protein